MSPVAGLAGSRRRRALRACCSAVAAAAFVLAISGCGAPGPRKADAVLAARNFQTALNGGSFGRACALLAPETRQEVAAADADGCVQALPQEHLPVASGAVADAVAEVYGRQAMVRLSGDTLFLSQFGKGWKVVAAGCTPRPDLPFDCQVKGG
ncbi:hypothetical protein [Streptomyces virginiae]|uniref:hypothetical protein n=1 Tax=Streptomyces virginiae TaxID=1961 RepID=UPI002DB72B78|nr:hypothetical protein [Streptomyces sp. CMAA1738]MEC4575780.1 hypothetical protein [Streptomyces sp. CMAA1738]